MEIAHVRRRAGSAAGCAPAAAHHTQALPDQLYIADDLLTLKLAVLGGGGMCWLPDYMCEEELRDGRLVRLLPDWSTPVGVVHAVFPSRRGLSPAVRSFLDFLGEYVPVCGSLQRRAA